MTVNRKETRIALAAYNTIQTKLIYISGPITSGKRLYEQFDKHNVTCKEDLELKLGQNAYNTLVVQPNIQDIQERAKQVVQKRMMPVILPSDFCVTEWHGNDGQYMDMWLGLIENKIQSMYMVDGWEYSTGATLEVAKGIETTLNRPQEPIHIYDTNTKLSSQYIQTLSNFATNMLSRLGYECESLKQANKKLKTLTSLL